MWIRVKTKEGLEICDCSYLCSWFRNHNQETTGLENMLIIWINSHIICVFLEQNMLSIRLALSVQVASYIGHVNYFESSTVVEQMINTVSFLKKPSD
jgi:hypothetical protein